MGGLAAEAAGGDFKTGALAAGLNEALVDTLAQQYAGMDPDQKKGLLVMNSQVIGVLAAAAQGNDDPENLQTGAWVAGNATQYNFLTHQDVEELAEKARNCDAAGNCEELNGEAQARSQANHDRLMACQQTGDCYEIWSEIDGGSGAIDALVASLPDGRASDILGAFTGFGGDNVEDWLLGGQLQLDKTANLWVNGDPGYITEFGKYLDESGFNPFSIGMPVIAGSGSGSSAGKYENGYVDVFPGSVGGAKATAVPKGFSSADDFARFGADTRDGLTRAGYGNVEPILQGSAVTGQSFRTGQAFDVGRVSDFDIALASPELLQRAQSLGIGLRSGGTRTGPLSARDLQALGLKDLASQLSSRAGREVNFMIYDSAATATGRAPSVALPK
jgi:filamentous hemagglutinin